MTETPKAVATEIVYGTAKKMSIELEKLPLQTHGAIISMMTTMAKHREANMQMEQHQAQERANETAMEDARKAHAAAKAERDAQIARTIVAANVSQPEVAPKEHKAPRMAVVIEGGKVVEETVTQ